MFAGRWREEGGTDEDVTIRGFPRDTSGGDHNAVITVTVRPDGTGVVHRVVANDTWQV